MTKRHKPIRTPVMRGEAAYYLSKLVSLGGDTWKIGRLLWRHGFRAGVKAARRASAENKRDERGED